MAKRSSGMAGVKLFENHDDDLLAPVSTGEPQLSTPEAQLGVLGFFGQASTPAISDSLSAITLDQSGFMAPDAAAAAGNHFGMPQFELAAFGPDAGGWSSDDTYPRELADVDGDVDGRADIVGFSSAGVYVSLATAGGHFAAPALTLAAFGTNADAGGWSSDNIYPREVADVNGDGLADIVGFSSAGVYVSLAIAEGFFDRPTFELANFGTNAGGWSSDDTYPRELADVNGDGRADIVGFGAAGVYVSLAAAGGHFAAPTFELANFGTNAGGWSSQNLYPRELAHVSGTGGADIVGFASNGVWVSDSLF